MISTLDLLYIVLTLCIVVLTVMLVLIGIEVLQVVKDVRKISDNVENIAGMFSRLVRLIVPGMERVARDTLDIENRVHSFFTRWFKRGNETDESGNSSSKSRKKK